MTAPVPPWHSSGTWLVDAAGVCRGSLDDPKLAERIANLLNQDAELLAQMKRQGGEVER